MNFLRVSSYFDHHSTGGDEDDAVTLSSEDGMNKIIHAVAASKKAEREGGGSSRTASGGPQPNFIVTLDGIDKNYFNASADGLISEHKPGILKLKKHDTNSQTVYIKTNKSQINLDDKVLKQPTFNVTDHSKSTSKERSSPTKEKKDEKRPSSSPSKTTSILRSSTGAAGMVTGTIILMYFSRNFP